jgi:hypothetical protein
MRLKTKNVRRPYLWLLVFLLPAGLFVVTVANALARDRIYQLDDIPQIAKTSVWSPKSNETALAVQDCLFTDDLQSCMQEIMEQAGASPEAIQFMQYFKGSAYLDDFLEVGRVDIGTVFYPFRANGNVQALLLNGEPRIVHTDDFFDIKNLCSAEAEDFYDLYPNEWVDFFSNRYEYYHNLPGGGQRFVFSYPIMDGCRACPIVGYAFVAYDFSDLGYFLAPRVLTISKTRESGLKQFPKPSGDLLKIEKLVDTKITFLGFDGNIWMMESDGSQMAPFVSQQEGNISTYTWAPGGEKLAYVLNYEDGRNAIRLFNRNTGEDKLLVDRADFYIWGGIAFNPSGDKIAYTSGFTDIYLLDLVNGQKNKIHSLEIIGLGPGVPPLAGGITWSSPGDHLAVDVFVGEAAVLAMSGIPTVTASSDITGTLTRPRIAPDDSSVAWLVLAEGRQLRLTNFAGEVFSQFSVPDGSSFGGLSWSSDGSVILLSGDEGLLAIDVNSGNTKVIQGRWGAWNPQWSPDGSAIVYNHLPPLEGRCRNEGNLHLVSSDGLRDFDFWIAGKYPAWYPPPGQAKPTETPEPVITPTPLPPADPILASIGFKYPQFWADAILKPGLEDTRKSAQTARRLLQKHGYQAPILETISVIEAIPYIENSSVFYFHGHSGKLDDRTAMVFWDGGQNSFLFGGSPETMNTNDPYRFISKMVTPGLKLVVINACESGKDFEKEDNLLRSFLHPPVNVVIGFNVSVNQRSSIRWGNNYWKSIEAGKGAIEAAKEAALIEEKAIAPRYYRITVQSLVFRTDLEKDLIIVPAPPHSEQ